jgi:hypothetical protein
MKGGQLTGMSNRQLIDSNPADLKAKITQAEAELAKTE